MLRSLIVASAVCVLSASPEARAQAGRDQSSAASVSPNGKQLAYLCDRGDGSQVCVGNVDGSQELQLTQGPIPYGRPRWNRDGLRLNYAVFEKGVSLLFESAPDGGQSVRVATVPGRNPILLPDPKSVLFSTLDGLTMQIMVSYRDGSNAKRISDGVGAISNAVISPDGKQVAFTRKVRPAPLSVWVMNIDGTSARQVTRFSAGDGGPQFPAWSPDGRQLAVQSAVRNSRDTTKSIGHIWVVELATGKATKLAPHNAPYVDEIPDWFPDGKRIAFQSDRSGKMAVWIMNADGTGARQVTK